MTAQPPGWSGFGWRPFPGPPDLAWDGLFAPKLVVEHGGIPTAIGRVRENGREDAWSLATYRNGWRRQGSPLPFTATGPWELVSLGEELLLRGGYPRPTTDGSGLLWSGERLRDLVLPARGASLDAAVLFRGRPVVAWSATADRDTTRFGLAVREAGDWRVLMEGRFGKVTGLTVWEDRLVAAFYLAHPLCSVQHAVQLWDGEAWRPLPGDFGAGRIGALAVHDGALVAGGRFAGVDSIACANLAFTDGAIWRPVAGGTDDGVRRLVSQGGSLWCAGSFRTAGGIPSHHIARWDGPLPRHLPIDSLPRYRPPAPRGRLAWHTHSLPNEDPAGPFRNGDFAAWADGAPPAWSVSVRDRRQTGARIEELPDGAGARVGLVVPAGDHASCSLRQRFAVEAGRGYRPRLLARLRPLDPGADPARCHLWLSDYARRLDGFEYGPLHGGMSLAIEDTALRWRELTLLTAREADVAVLSIGLDGAGWRLDVHEVRLDTVSVDAVDCLDLLLAELRDRCVLLEPAPPIDWPRLREAYASRVAASATHDDYAGVICELLRELPAWLFEVMTRTADVGQLRHVGGSALSCSTGDPADRDRWSRIRLQLMDVEDRCGWTRDGLLYVKSDLRALRRLAPEDLRAARGLLLDLRRLQVSAPRHGDELQTTLGWLGRYVTEPVTYALVQRRDGEAWSDPEPLRLAPLSADEPPPPPLVVLVDGTTRGEAAELALALRAVPGVTLVGRPSRTRGSPLKRFSLPNGVHVDYPDLLYRHPDGRRVTDEEGVAPDLLVAPADGDDDPVFERGLEALRRMVGAAESPAGGRRE